MIEKPKPLTFVGNRHTDPEPLVVAECVELGILGRAVVFAKGAAPYWHYTDADELTTIAEWLDAASNWVAEAPGTVLYDE